MHKKFIIVINENKWDQMFTFQTEKRIEEFRILSVLKRAFVIFNAAFECSLHEQK